MLRSVDAMRTSPPLQCDAHQATQRGARGCTPLSVAARHSGTAAFRGEQLWLGPYTAGGGRSVLPWVQSLTARPSRRVAALHMRRYSRCTVKVRRRLRYPLRGFQCEMISLWHAQRSGTGSGVSPSQNWMADAVGEVISGTRVHARMNCVDFCLDCAATDVDGGGMPGF